MLEKIRVVKKNVLHILSEITVIEYQVHQMTLKHRSPPRKKHVAEAMTRKRIQPVPAEATNVHPSFALNTEPGTDFNILERRWHTQRAETLKHKQPLEALAHPKKQYIERSDTHFVTDDGEMSQLPDLFFEEGFEHRAKGHTRETVSQWFHRLKDAIDTGKNPILSVQGLETLFQKLARVNKDVQKPNQKLLIDSIHDFAIMKGIFRQIYAVLSKAASKLKT